MKPLKTEIIAVGTELLLGQIANTNAQWLSQQLALYGVNTYYHTVVGDNLERLESIFRQAQHRSDVIIVTGGLGPTEDDLTREAFQKMSNYKIIDEKESMQKIESYFKKQKSEMTPNNRRQARVFEISTVLTNKTGMAPGMIVSYEEKVWIFLPGVPREMKQLARDDVFPYLRKLNGHTIIQSTVLRFIGIGESILEHKLQDLIQNQSNPTIAPLAARDGVTIRLTAKAESVDAGKLMLEKTQDKVLAIVGDHFYGTDDEAIEDVIVNLLQKRKLKVAAAESLTGGLFTEKLISVPGVSCVCPGGIVCYDPSVKENVLGVSKHTIKDAGTVSEQCAREMAKNVKDLLDADIGISFTGVAGPERTEGKDVGTVYIGIYTTSGYEFVQRFTFQGERNTIRYRAVLKGMELLFDYLK